MRGEKLSLNRGKFTWCWWWVDATVGWWERVTAGSKSKRRNMHKWCASFADRDVNSRIDMYIVHVRPSSQARRSRVYEMTPPRWFSFSLIPHFPYFLCRVFANSCFADLDESFIARIKQRRRQRRWRIVSVFVSDSSSSRLLNRLVPRGIRDSFANREEFCGITCF